MGDETKDLGTRISIKPIGYTSSHEVKVVAPFGHFLLACSASPSLLRLSRAKAQLEREGGYEQRGLQGLAGFKGSSRRSPQ